MAEKKYRAELVGVFGDPVDGNPTGVVEEAGFAATRLNYRYITCLVKRGDIANAILGMRAMNMRGVNLTMPHKVDVLPYLDEITPAARIIGAVNTVVNRGGHLLGENTDGKGFVKSLTDEGIDLHGKTVCLLGAGGAARAIGVECALNDANKIIIVNRNAERGTALRDAIAEEGRKRGWRTFLPEFRFTTDNAAMIAVTGYFKYQRGEFAPMDISPVARISRM